jgi:quinol monooxygenase YgiN
MAKVTFISRMSVKQGQEATFVRLCRELAEVVHATEPDTLHYEFFRLEGSGRYAVIESFASEAAEQAHMTSEALQRLGPGIIECLDGPYEREYLYPFE